MTAGRQGTEDGAGAKGVGRISPLGKKALRSELRREQRKRQTVRGVFLAMQNQPLRSRLTLCRKLICRTDLKALAKKKAVPVRDLMSKPKHGGGK